jgi:hypothetical protein
MSRKNYESLPREHFGQRFARRHDNALLARGPLWVSEMRPIYKRHLGGIYSRKRQVAAWALAIGLGTAVRFVEFKDIARSAGVAIIGPRHYEIAR